MSSAFSPPIPASGTADYAPEMVDFVNMRRTVGGPHHVQSEERIDPGCPTAAAPGVLRSENRARSLARTGRLAPQ